MNGSCFSVETPRPEPRSRPWRRTMLCVTSHTRVCQTF
ncbi:hypothetical protein ARZXY2_3103 [Arthrobacter sp. ZXY-2]|nr:hypothetical protein ARZXY2_3103 [Arthrobacter sp. ZXY-2]